MLRFIVPLLLIIVPWVVIGMWGVTGIVPALVFDVILIALSIRIVWPKTVRTVEFLGKYNRILRPGFHFIVPFVEWTKAQDLYRKNFSVEVEWVTSDNVTAYIGLNVIYFIDDDGDDSEMWPIFKSVYSIDNPRTMMKSTIDEQLRWMIVMFTHKEIFGKREEIWEVIEEKLREKLGQFGFRIDSIQVRDVQLEGTVMQAMNKVVESAKLKEAAYNEAEAQKIMQVKQAEAEKESKVLIWEWMAGQRMAIAKWFQESVDMIKAADNALTWDKILAFLLDSSRIETLWNIGNNDGSKLVYLNENLEWKSSKLLAGSDIMDK